MNKIHYNWSDVQGACLDLARQINLDQWAPDYIVGITRGGLVPAVLLSQYLNVKCHTLHVSLRDGGETESNLWMAEHALGYVPAEHRSTSGTQVDPAFRKKILIVDDINDQGSTLAWIRKDWKDSCLPRHPAWEVIWGNNVRVAVLTNNIASPEEVNYHAWEVNKAEEDCWLVYPWEEFWKNGN